MKIGARLPPGSETPLLGAWRNGRRSGLKIHRSYEHEGSNPSAPTTFSYEVHPHDVVGGAAWPWDTWGTQGIPTSLIVQRDLADRPRPPSAGGPGPGPRQSPGGPSRGPAAWDRALGQAAPPGGVATTAGARRGGGVCPPPGCRRWPAADRAEDRSAPPPRCHQRRAGARPARAAGRGGRWPAPHPERST